jgi:hypothetical protein
MIADISRFKKDSTNMQRGQYMYLHMPPGGLERGGGGGGGGVN